MIRRILEFNEWKKSAIAVCHMKRSPQTLVYALEELGIPYKEFFQSDGDNMENEFLSKSDEFCGLIIGGGKIERGENLPRLSEEFLNFDIPKLGICLGNEILGTHLGSDIIICNRSEPDGEDGEVLAKIYPDEIFNGLDAPSEQMVRMEHFYMLDRIPDGSTLLASTDMTPIAGFHNNEKNIWGLQFHPEKDWIKYIVLKNFYKICTNKILNNKII